MSLRESVKELKKIHYTFSLKIKVLYLDRNGFVGVLGKPIKRLEIIGHVQHRLSVYASHPVGTNG